MSAHKVLETSRGGHLPVTDVTDVTLAVVCHNRHECHALSASHELLHFVVNQRDVSSTFGLGFRVYQFPVRLHLG